MIANPRGRRDLDKQQRKGIEELGGGRLEEGGEVREPLVGG